MPALIVARAVAPTAYSSGVPFETARDYLLSLPGLPEDVASQLRGFSGDGTTLPLPVPAEELTSSDRRRRRRAGHGAHLARRRAGGRGLGGRRRRHRGGRLAERRRGAVGGPRAAVGAGDRRAGRRHSDAAERLLAELPPSPAVWCSGLRKRYRRQTAVDGVSFTVGRGEVVGLLGPNGAGKTSVIKILLGLVRPDAGEVLLLGRPARDPRARARVGYLPELFRYQPWLTAAEVLALHVRLAGRRRCRPRSGASAWPLVGLADRAGDRVGGFSKGMQQRLGLAVALVARPELVVLDEPTSALDPIGRADVRDLLLVAQGARGRRAAQLAPHRRGRAGLRPGRHPRQGPGRRLRHPGRAARPARAAAAARRGRARRRRRGWPPPAGSPAAATRSPSRCPPTRTPPPCRTSWPTWSASGCACTPSSPAGSASRSGCWTSSAPEPAVSRR